MNKTVIITLIIFIVITLLTISYITFQLQINDIINNNLFLSKDSKFKKNELSVINKDKILTADMNIKDSTNDITKNSNFTNKLNILKNDNNFKELNKNETKITNIKIENDNEFNKGSDFKNINFNSLGEYVSNEEKEYRVNLVKNLKIKTVIIDYLTDGNGITQEYYKVVYLDQMIPAKILDQLVESKEFRDLIPKQYIKNEKDIIKFNKNTKIKFSNEKIRELLLLWSNGRLTPVKKAWETKAVK